MDCLAIWPVRSQTHTNFQAHASSRDEFEKFNDCQGRGLMPTRSGIVAGRDPSPDSCHMRAGGLDPNPQGRTQPQSQHHRRDGFHGLSWRGEPYPPRTSSSPFLAEVRSLWVLEGPKPTHTHTTTPQEEPERSSDSCHQARTQPTHPIPHQRESRRAGPQPTEPAPQRRRTPRSHLEGRP